jgi:hypothetical protein
VVASDLRIVEGTLASDQRIVEEILASDQRIVEVFRAAARSWERRALIPY